MSQVDTSTASKASARRSLSPLTSIAPRLSHLWQAAVSFSPSSFELGGPRKRKARTSVRSGRSPKHPSRTKRPSSAATPCPPRHTASACDTRR
eukprot:scaffold303243_cov30-Tisochrysis_lutea.AAC.4